MFGKMEAVLIAMETLLHLALTCALIKLNRKNGYVEGVEDAMNTMMDKS